jgi:hypothetical protein
LGFSVESSAGDPVGVPVGAVVPVGEPEEAEEDAVPVDAGVDVADGDEVAVGEGSDEPLGFSGLVTSLFAWWVILMVMVVSEYVDFLPAVLPPLVTGLLEPFMMASAMACSRLGGSPEALEAEGVVVVVPVGVDAEDVGVAVAVEDDAGVGESWVSCRLA